MTTATACLLVLTGVVLGVALTVGVLLWMLEYCGRVR